MSWIENINTDIVIQTGDGKQYFPLWRPTSKGIEYNVAQFEFINKAGTLVKRGTPKGTRYSFEVIFQGEQYLELAKAFEVSANDSRPWTILHPQFGTMIVQPVSLDFDYSAYNLVLVSGSIIETITETATKITIVPRDKVEFDKGALDMTYALNWENTQGITSIDETFLADTLEDIYNTGEKVAPNTDAASEYYNLFTEANAAILEATTEPLAAMRKIQAVLNYPALFADSVKNRINLLIEQYESLQGIIDNLDSQVEKKTFEAFGGAIISSIAQSAVTPLTGNYANKTDVLAIIDLILESWSGYIEDLDSMQDENGGLEGGFVPDFTSIAGLSSLVNFTVSNLFETALGARQERSILLEDDSNVILLAHRFYGLDADDTIIEEFMNNNNIGLSEILLIRKGRRLIYYV
jgi:hypothetical protein